MKIPPSMTDELQAWNDGNGIDLEGWINGAGSFSLAVGYITIFWPEFVQFDGYILRAGFCEKTLRSFEEEARNRKSVEWVMNHLHIADVQYHGCEDLTKDKLQVIGTTLQEIYATKLKAQFPHASCVVEFYQPENEDDLQDYQISFWQTEDDPASP